MIALNTFVHVVMYTYYFLSSIGPKAQKYLWWKRYLTQLQITQFIVAMVHGSIPLFYDCGYPKLKGFQTVCNAQGGLHTSQSKTTKVQ
ncbi:hypothetical protein MRX96_012938 [Rhipicephalus microplus]